MNRETSSVNSMPSTPARRSPVAFVTGATGLLGNNLVRALLADGFEVKVLARSQQKAERQFGDVMNGQMQIVVGDMLDVAGFAPALHGADVIFHTAAYFRDSYTGGAHWDALCAINVTGTRHLLEHAWRAGVRRMVHASSIAVLHGERGQVIDETMVRNERNADDYYRSKILSDREVFTFLEHHPDMWAAMVLPGWMHGPGDLGPTSAGQTVIDIAQGKLPGIPPGSVTIVDARDVAQAMILAYRHGRRAERYLAAGRHMTMAQLLPLIAQATGAKAPSRTIPLWLLHVIAAMSEVRARVTRKPVLLSWATVRAIATENDRSRFDHRKSEDELGLLFRPLEDTLHDEVAWFVAQGMLPASVRSAADVVRLVAAS